MTQGCETPVKTSGAIKYEFGSGFRRYECNEIGPMLSNLFSLSSWQSGQGNYLKLREELFGSETVKKGTKSLRNSEQSD